MPARQRHVGALAPQRIARPSAAAATAGRPRGRRAPGSARWTGRSPRARSRPGGHRRLPTGGFLGLDVELQPWIDEPTEHACPQRRPGRRRAHRGRRRGWRVGQERGQRQLRAVRVRGCGLSGAIGPGKRRIRGRRFGHGVGSRRGVEQAGLAGTCAMGTGWAIRHCRHYGEAAFFPPAAGPAASDASARRTKSARYQCPSMRTAGTMASIPRPARV